MEITCGRFFEEDDWTFSLDNCHKVSADRIEVAPESRSRDITVSEIALSAFESLKSPFEEFKQLSEGRSMRIRWMQDALPMLFVSLEPSSRTH